jgi:hypothetical protein
MQTDCRHVFSALPLIAVDIGSDLSSPTAYNVLVSAVQMHGSPSHTSHRSPLRHVLLRWWSEFCGVQMALLSFQHSSGKQTHALSQHAFASSRPPLITMKRIVFLCSNTPPNNQAQSRLPNMSTSTMPSQVLTTPAPTISSSTQTLTTQTLTTTTKNHNPPLRPLVKYQPSSRLANPHLPFPPNLRPLPPKGTSQPRHARRPLHPPNLATSSRPRGRKSPGPIPPSPQRAAAVSLVHRGTDPRVWLCDAVRARRVWLCDAVRARREARVERPASWRGEVRGSWYVMLSL